YLRPGSRHDERTVAHSLASDRRVREHGDHELARPIRWDQEPRLATSALRAVRCFGPTARRPNPSGPPIVPRAWRGPNCVNANPFTPVRWSISQHGAAPT